MLFFFGFAYAYRLTQLTTGSLVRFVTICAKQTKTGVGKNGEYVSASRLSTGTMDQLYLAFRLSIIKEISKQKNDPEWMAEFRLKALETKTVE